MSNAQPLSAAAVRLALPLLLVLLLPAAVVYAHPVPRKTHDRTIGVRLTGDSRTLQVNVLVDYRLEVDELTVVLDDMAPFSEQVDYSRFRNKPNEFYAEFTRIYAPILADNLVAKVDGKPLAFECVKREHRLRDEKDQPLGHLRCDFRFRAVLAGRTDQVQQLTLREGNYELETGKIDLSIGSEAPIQIQAKTEPDAALKKRAESQLQPGDEAKLRQVAATFTWSASRESTLPPTRPDQGPAPKENVAPDEDLFRLFMDSDDGFFWVLLLLAAGLGAVHALTPGHGKTLVAAYLVGERGTILHALVLGVVTTLTHTGVVLAIATGLLFASEETRRTVQAGLGLAMGLLVAGLGIWLLLRRLSGQADHFHFGSHDRYHHHHSRVHDHAHADHEHDEHGHIISRSLRKEPVGWWGLIVLGMSGGIVPCWDAVAMLVVAVGMDRLALALPLLLAFSAGLAGVLVLIGVLVVYARNFASSQWGEGRLVRALPIASAAVIAALGFWLCYQSVHAQAAQPSPAARAAARSP